MADYLIIGIDEWSTGQRADGVIDLDDIRQGNLICPGGPLHQRDNSMPGGDFEIRRIEDGRDITQYEGSWTVHFDDGTAETTKSAVVTAVDAGKSIVDIDGVIPIPEAEVSAARKVLEAGLLPRYFIDGEPQDVRDWANANDVSLTGTRYEKMQQAYDSGCPFIIKNDPLSI